VRLTRLIQSQLDNDSPGLVGYSLNARVLTRKFWTLSAWESRKALVDFVMKDPHRKAMLDLRNRMGGTKFVTWSSKGSSLPPSWEEAFSRLNTPSI